MALTLKKPAQAQEGMDALLYGKPKTGKTSTLDDAGMRILIADLEGGTAVLSEAENTDVMPISTWEELCELGDSVKRGYFVIDGQKVPWEWDMLAIDSITRMQDLCKDFIANRYAPNRKREIPGKFSGMLDWGDLKDLMTSLVKGFHGLTKRADKSIHLMWLAHVEFVTDPDAASKIMGTKVQVQGKETGDIIMSIVDGIFYMDKVEKEGKEHFFVRTKKHGYIDAGVRQSKRRDPLPAVIENPQWSQIFETLGYVRK